MTNRSTGRPHRLRRGAARGIVAGAAGTCMLNIATYLDQAIRGRPSSALPAQAATRLTRLLDIDLTKGDADVAAHRQDGLGALLGYATGLAVGASCGIATKQHRTGVVGVAIAATVVAMVAGDAPMTIMDLTDPRTWTAKEWIADVLPHTAYGLATALTLRALAS